MSPLLQRSCLPGLVELFVELLVPLCAAVWVLPSCMTREALQRHVPLSEIVWDLLFDMALGVLRHVVLFEIVWARHIVLHLGGRECLLHRRDVLRVPQGVAPTGMIIDPLVDLVEGRDPVPENMDVDVPVITSMKVRRKEDDVIDCLVVLLCVHEI